MKNQEASDIQKTALPETQGAARMPQKTLGLPVVIVAGLSGSGKSTVLQVFEDMNYFKLDGLPPELLADTVSVLNHDSLSRYRGIVVGMDLRQKAFVEDFHKAMSRLFAGGPAPVLLYVEADSEVIIRRYATTRRPHPLEREGISLERSIAEERRRLAPIRDMADLVLDTSRLSIHDLRRLVQKRWRSPAKDARLRNMRVNLVSFGFKYGLPADAEMVFDLRMLQNPYFDPLLRPLSGKDKLVSDYVLEQEPGREFFAQLLDFIRTALQLFEKEGRYRVTIALGCTGGRHRSVAVAEAVGRALKKMDYAVTIEHRHMDLG